MNLDVEALYKQYKPLMKSIYKKFSHYNNVFTSDSDFEDLQRQIEFEFVRLCREYDPTRGVDFPGFIKSHLQQRVYHYVTKFKKTQYKEIVSPPKTDEDTESYMDFSNTDELVDMDADKAIERVEALACLNWDIISGKKHRKLINDILYNQKTLEEIAQEEHVSLKTIRLRLHFVCKKLIEYEESQQDSYDVQPLTQRIPIIRKAIVSERKGCSQ